MAIIRPFRAVRYRSAKLGKLVAPPYDVITSLQKKKLLASDPFNVIRLILGNPSHETHQLSDYRGAQKAFTKWRRTGALVRDPQPGLYVYQQAFKVLGKSFRRTGFIALSQLTPFGKKKGGILAHEHTLSGPKADRLKLTKACRANFSCIFSLYPDQAGVRKVLAKVTARKPDVSVTYPAGIENKVWRVSDQASLEAVKRKMKPVTLFIADGHHRYETALAYQAFRSKTKKGKLGTRSFDHVLMMFVAMEDPGLVILPTHRMLPKRLIGSPSMLLSRLSSLGEVMAYPGKVSGLSPWKWLAKQGKTEPSIGLSFDGKKLYALRFAKAVAKSPLLADVSDAQKKLDVTLLHRMVLEPFFGITKEKVEEEISFTAKAEEAVERLRKGGRQNSKLLFKTFGKIGRVIESG